MKKALITLTTMALLGATVPRVHAGGGHGGAIAAGVVVGIGGGLLLAKALEPQPVYAATPVYVTPAPVVVQQQPVYVQAAPQQVIVQQPVQTVTIAQPVVVQQPVIYQPAPVFYAPAPVYVRPVCAPPVISFGFSFGPGYRHHGYGRRW